MLRLEAKSDYADVMERALFNNVLGSMARDGQHFFYVNPMEVWPEASHKNPDKFHIKPVRQQWFGCSCCPPNVARLLSSLNDYIYDVDHEGQQLYVHLFIGSEITFEAGGSSIIVKQQSALPWSGEVKFTLSIAGPSLSAPFALMLRIPSWFQSGEAVLRVNGERQPYSEVKGYAKVERVWDNGDIVEWTLPVETKFVAAHPNMRSNAGKVAIQRGPLVYCVEGTDHDGLISSLRVSLDAGWEEHNVPDQLGGYVMLELQGTAISSPSAWKNDELYRPEPHREEAPATIKAIPYYLWGNREPGEMNVWLKR